MDSQNVFKKINIIVGSKYWESWKVGKYGNRGRLENMEIVEGSNIWKSWKVQIFGNRGRFKYWKSWKVQKNKINKMFSNIWKSWKV